MQEFTIDEFIGRVVTPVRMSTGVLGFIGRYRRPRWLVVASLWLTRIRLFVALPDVEGTRLTWKRLVNCYLNRWELFRLRTTLRSLPPKLTIEPINVCNLRCPACFTGDGQVSRARTAIPMDFYLRLLDEIGDTLCCVEFCNWGEPLLNKQIHTLIRAATDRGIGTLLSTNLSFPFSAERAEELVRSGLTKLGVSIDGARQDSYEQYRRGGNLALVLENCRRLRDAKLKLGSTAPKLVWSFHMFPHNVGDVEAAHMMAREFDMEFMAEKGWVVGDEWGRGTPLESKAHSPFPCLFLWYQAVVNADGGVSPCCGTFYREDDMGQLALRPQAEGAATFRDVWNGERFRQARAMYVERAAAAAKDRICYDCPITVDWERWQRHVAAGGDHASFTPRVTANDSFNFFWSRRPPGVAAPRRRPMIGPR